MPIFTHDFNGVMGFQQCAILSPRASGGRRDLDRRAAGARLGRFIRSRRSEFGRSHPAMSLRLGGELDGRRDFSPGTREGQIGGRIRQLPSSGSNSAGTDEPGVKLAGGARRRGGAKLRFFFADHDTSTGGRRLSENRASTIFRVDRGATARGCRVSPYAAVSASGWQT